MKELLVRIQYPSFWRRDCAAVIKVFVKVSSYSRQQLTWLITQYRRARILTGLGSAGLLAGPRTTLGPTNDKSFDSYTGDSRAHVTGGRHVNKIYTEYTCRRETRPSL